MKKFILTLFLSGILFSGFSQKQLFNGKNLNGWDIYIGKAIDGFEKAKEEATPDSIYSIVEVDGQKVIRVSGEVFASLATKKEYSNYHLQLEFKWGDKIYDKRNSGLLYHGFGDFGAAFDTWMTNIECQLMHGRLGDTYLMNNTCCETEVEKNSEGKFQYKQGGTTEKFGQAFKGQNITKASDAEKPLGEWNTVDLYCFGTTSVHVVNGTVVMVNKNPGKMVDGKLIPLSKGKIQIQSEGAELFIRKIEIEKVK